MKKKDFSYSERNSWTINKKISSR